MKLFMVFKPIIRNNVVPMYYYAFAESGEQAIEKVKRKFGDPIVAYAYIEKDGSDIKEPEFAFKELTQKQMDDMVIASNYYV